MGFCQFFLLITLLVVAVLCSSHAFTPSHQYLVCKITRASSSPTLTTGLFIGLFDGIMKASDNEEYSIPPEGIKATARHILCKQKEEAEMVLEKLRAVEQGGDGGSNSNSSSSSSLFANLAQQYSSCPSKNQGGSLGSFRPGTMVPAFDKVIFNTDTQIGKVVGPVQTEFGYHVIVVDKRTGI